MIPAETRRDPHDLLEFLEREQVTRLMVPFVALQQIADAAAARAGLRLALREVITAGEQLQGTEKILALFRRLPGCALHNQYGPTESHVVTSHVLAGDPAAWPSLPPIGRPITNARTYVLDRHQQPVPIGVSGELYLGGGCLADGYLHHPELTAERFVPDPFQPQTGARMYRSGDIARSRPGGILEFLGRSDAQVKIRGYRVELGEVEAVLASHSSVAGCAVAARGAGPTARRLVGYVVFREGTSVPLAELRQFLCARLPDYMVPSVMIVLPHLPLTPSGKIDRRSLPSMEGMAEAPAARPVNCEPRNATERVIAEACSEVLGAPLPGVEVSFFDAGGHSLAAMQLAARLQQQFEIRLPVRVIFENPTIAALAQYITGQTEKNHLAHGPAGSH